MTTLGPGVRDGIVREILARLDAHAASPTSLPLTPTLDRARSRAWLDALDLEVPRDPSPLFRALLDAMDAGQVHTRHPRYGGPPQPAVSDVAWLAELLVAAWNPQLAVTQHAPFAVEVEARVLRAFASRLGLDPSRHDGAFTTGGAESNLSAVLLALEAACPAWREGGVRALEFTPIAYASADAHPTVQRALRVAGLGDAALRLVPTDRVGRMKPALLSARIAADRAAGSRPFLVVATLGTTALGALDPLAAVADIAARAGAWLHVDAAYGGVGALAAPHAPCWGPLARADSISIDPHKTLAVPLGAGALLTRHPGARARVFGAEAGYMPRDAGDAPFAGGLRWSRRFTGLASFVVLATEGFEGLAAAQARRCTRAERLRIELVLRCFRVVNDTPLPLVCVVPRRGSRGLDALARRVIAEGAGWLSVVRASNGVVALRVCLEHADAEDADLDALVQALARATQ